MCESKETVHEKSIIGGDYRLSTFYQKQSLKMLVSNTFIPNDSIESAK
jgi:hypothetical protein